MIMDRARGFKAALALAALALVFAAPADAGGGQEQAQARVARLFQAADAAFEQGDFATALDNYFEVTTVSLDRSELARASVGLAVCYFSMNDRDGAARWIAQALEHDPKREPIDRIYPESFVALFAEVRDARQRAAEPARQEAQPEAPPAAPRPQEPPKQEPQAAPPAQPKTGIHLLGDTDWRDKWEVEAHISSWSLNPVKSLFESFVTDNLAEEVRDQVLKQLRKSYPLLVQTGYEETIVFDSEGSNYGFGVRFYPRGRKGGFSLELSVEKTRLKLMISGPVKQTYAPGGSSQVDSNGYIEASPFSTNLSFRWEFVPSWRVTPYFSCGLGLAALDGEVGYAWKGTFQYSGQEKVIEDDQVKTFVEAEEETDLNIPNIFVILHLGLGVKGEFVPGLSGIAEAGFWDGIMFRAGVAYRFNF
jgi:tetratricopeptide (TPR) repeat protein